jgi:hypothetical protein
VVYKVYNAFKVNRYKKRRGAMKLKKTILVFLISIISIFPLIAEAQVLTSSNIPESVTLGEVHHFIWEYPTRFMKMDFDAFMELFSREAVENRMIPYSDIREAYRSTISYNQSILYNLKIYSIQPYTRSAFVRGRYEIIQTIKKGGKKKAFHGDIQWDIVREDGSLKIREVNYGRDRWE